MKSKKYQLFFSVFILFAVCPAFAEDNQMGDAQFMRQKFENMGLVSNYDSNDNEKEIIAHKLKRSEVTRRLSENAAQFKKQSLSIDDLQNQTMDDLTCSTCVTTE